MLTGETCSAKNKQVSEKNYSTNDHLFTLRNLIDIYLSNHRKLYCAFVDYRKAFDSVHRISLWGKLIDAGINSKLLTVIINMYEHAKSCVKASGKLTEFFKCMAGVRQGENLSPLLFALFLNDMKTQINVACPV